MIFFVLSGRVIHISEYQKARKTWEFYRVRLWRIYPPLIAMLLLTTLMKFFGLIENKINFAELIGTLLSIQDIASLKPGVIANPYLSNDPLWSLSYEMFFYFSYIPIRNIMLKNLNRTYNLIAIWSFTGLISYLYFPNHFSLVSSYLIAWWIGYFSFTTIIVKPYFRQFFIVLLLDIMVLLIYTYFHANYSVGVFPGLLARHFTFLMFLLLILRNKSLKMVISKILLKLNSLKALTSLSYGLYISHFPILILWKSENFFDYFFKIPLMFLISYIIESTKYNPLYRLKKG